MRAAFVTCVELGRACIEEVCESGGQFELLITLPDDRAPKKSGRVYLDDLARDRSIDLLKTPNVNDPGVVEEIRRRGIDWLFIIGWSQIAKPEVLSAPRLGALGAHPTLLPVGRGRAAIPWAILKGLDETGVTLFQLDEGVDSGPILAQERIPIAADETATRLYEKVAQAHRALMRRVWPDLRDGTIRPRAQDESLATYWPGRKPEDGRIERSMTVQEVDRLVRATTHPYPGAFIDVGEERIRVWQGATSRRSDSDLPLHVDEGTYWASRFDVESPDQDA